MCMQHDAETPRSRPWRLALQWHFDADPQCIRLTPEGASHKGTKPIGHKANWTKSQLDTKPLGPRQLDNEPFRNMTPNGHDASWT